MPRVKGQPRQESHVPDPPPLSAVWATKSEAAGYLRRSVRTFDELRSKFRATFPKGKDVNGSVLWRVADLQAWIDSQADAEFSTRGGLRESTLGRGGRRARKPGAVHDAPTEAAPP